MHVHSQAYLYIPSCQACKFTYGLFAKNTHTHTCSPYTTTPLCGISMCTGPFAWRSYSLSLLAAHVLHSFHSQPSTKDYTLHLLCSPNSLIFYPCLRLRGFFFPVPTDDGLQNGPGLHRNSQGKQCRLYCVCLCC